MTRGRRLAGAVALVVLSAGLTVAALVAFDLHLHRRFESSAGLNVRGYRGRLLDRKAPGEQRIAVVGGSAAFGYGLTAEDSLPAYLERILNDPRWAARRVSVANLAYNSEGAYSLRHTLNDYAYLDYDVALIYSGYNDLNDEPNTQIYRHQSPIFRWTGYLPILPLVVREKLMLLRYGSLEAAYRAQRKPVFRPMRPGEASVRPADGVGQSLPRRAAGRASPSEAGLEAAGAACGPRWGFYCEGMRSAIEYALSRGRQVIVVNQPYYSELHRDQQAHLAAMVTRQFGHDPRVTYVNLGEAVDLEDRALCYDAMHLTSAGNKRVAQLLAGPVMETLRSRRPSAKGLDPSREEPS